MVVFPIGIPVSFVSSTTIDIEQEGHYYIEAFGANGGIGGTSAAGDQGARGAGGEGGTARGLYYFYPGDTLNIQVGLPGSRGYRDVDNTNDSRPYPGGAGGSGNWFGSGGNGGNGGDYSSVGTRGGSGGGGGAASGMLFGGTGIENVWLCAGGGGGGGGGSANGSPGGAGGAAGSNGTSTGGSGGSGQSATTNIGLAGASGSNGSGVININGGGGGGGGGGGYNGANGGGGNSGGGGSNGSALGGTTGGGGGAGGTANFISNTVPPPEGMGPPIDNPRTSGDSGQVYITYLAYLYPVPFSYLQIERTQDGEVASGSPVLFDHVLSSNGGRIGYTAASGEIIFRQAGYYHVEWFVATEFGLTTDGSNFALISPGNGPELTGSSHVRVSPTVGFAIIEVPEPEKTVRLINTSDNSLTLSSFAKAKAGLVAFLLADNR